MSRLSLCFQSLHQFPCSPELQLCSSIDYNILLHTYPFCHLIYTTGLFAFLLSLFAKIHMEPVELCRSLHEFFPIVVLKKAQKRRQMWTRVAKLANLLIYNQQPCSKFPYSISMSTISPNLIFFLQPLVLHEIESVYRAPAVHTTLSPNERSLLSHKHVNTDRARLTLVSIPLPCEPRKGLRPSYPMLVGWQLYVCSVYVGFRLSL